MKKVLSILGIFMVSLLFVTGCGNKMVHIEGSLEDLMAKVYGDIEQDKLPMGLMNQEITEENKARFIGEANFEYKEALASESMIGSFAHSVILIRMNEDATDKDIDNAIEELKANVDPRKWICVWAEEVHIERNGDLILVALSDEHAETLIENFKNLE